MHDQAQLREYPAWDRTVRWFHWINVLAVLGMIATGTTILYADELEIAAAGEVRLKTVHACIGYVFALNLIWRLIWAFFGGANARWRAILPFGRGWLAELKQYISALLAGREQQYLGHNPAGRLAVALLLLLLVNSASTGLVLAGTDLFFPPFGRAFAQWVAAPGVEPATVAPGRKDLVDEVAWTEMRAFRKPFKYMHRYGFYVLAVLIGLHIIGVALAELRGGGTLTSAMFSGRKVFHGAPVDDADSSA